MRQWSAAYLWAKRVERWDILEEERFETERRVMITQRRLEVIQRDWEQGVKLRDIADKILQQAVLFTKTTRTIIPGDASKGIPERHIETIALDASVMVKLIEIGSKLQRLAVGMESERAFYELSKLSDEELLQRYQEAVRAMVPLGDAEEGQENGAPQLGSGTGVQDSPYLPEA